MENIQLKYLFVPIVNKLLRTHITEFSAALIDPWYTKYVACFIKTLEQRWLSGQARMLYSGIL